MIGGGTLKDSVRRVMSHLLTNTLSRMYNWRVALGTALASSRRRRREDEGQSRSSSDLRAKFALINKSSIHNKALLVRDYIDEHELDVVAMTETRLGEDDLTVVSELCRDHFSFAHKSRGGARGGGGVGVLFRKTLRLVSRADIDIHASETCLISAHDRRLPTAII